MNDKALLELADDFDRRHKPVYLYCPLLSAALAGRDDADARLIMEVALKENIPVRTINEIILQSHLFLGFPAMIEASRMLAELTRPRPGRTSLPEAYDAAVCREWNRQGLRRIRRIYGPAFDRLVPYINSFSPQILTWMINDGYGQVLSRPGAAFRLRELSVVATLTVTSYVNQLKAHIRGSLNFGVEPALLQTTIDNCRFFCPSSNLTTAHDLLKHALRA